MLNWSVGFLILAIIAAILSTACLAGQAIELARIVFFVCLVLFLVGMIFGRPNGKDL